ncbi:MAG: VOC family protein [Bacteroidia bacterium]|nr:VOC family protein [Bacteroidia bacterium]
MPALNPYLNFDGTTEAAFTFYKEVFGGEFSFFSRMGETPDGANLPADEQQRIMHVALPIGPNHVLMGSDTLPSAGHVLQPGNNNYVMLSPDSEADTQRLYDLLSAGGVIEAPLEKTFWNAWFASFRDQFGTAWMINYDIPQA